MRYLPLTEKNRLQMLESIGVSSVEELYKDVPLSARAGVGFDLPDHQGELEVERVLGSLAAQNRSAGEGPFFLGAGVYNHHIPASVDYIIQRSEFLTSYTPYQPEIAQGTLQVIFEFQTLIARLTGQDVANASMYDGATSLAEAVLMSLRLTGRRGIVMATPLNPQYREVVESYTKGHGEIGSAIDENTACVIVQSPDFLGTPHAYAEFRARCDAVGAKLIVVITEIVSLGLLPAPVEADIVCGEAQSIGMPMSFGGPHLGFFAGREENLRQMPGRLCGETVDAEGQRSFVLTLVAREQHIRREKATSNICTNQGLCALAFTVHLSLLGEAGFQNLARINHERACDLAEALAKVSGVRVENETFFNEFVIRLSAPAEQVARKLLKKNIIAGLPLEGEKMLVAATEMTTGEDIAAFAEALGEWSLSHIK
jgi:glycine dehydrogenase subunit 1